jgi:hypothetical protein
LTSLSYLDSTLPNPMHHPRPLTDTERRRSRQYAEDYARIDPNSIFNLPTKDDMGERVEQRSED